MAVNYRGTMFIYLFNAKPFSSANTERKMLKSQNKWEGEDNGAASKVEKSETAWMKAVRGRLARGPTQAFYFAHGGVAILPRSQPGRDQLYTST